MYLEQDYNVLETMSLEWKNIRCFSQDVKCCYAVALYLHIMGETEGIRGCSYLHVVYSFQDS